MWLVIDNGGHSAKVAVAENLAASAREALRAAAAIKAEQPAATKTTTAEALRRAADSAVAVVPNCTACGKKDTLQADVLVGFDTEKPPGEREDAGRLVFTRSLERGYLTNIDCQQLVWEHALEHLGLAGANAVKGLVLSSPCFVPQEIQTATEALVHSTFGFKELVTAHPAELVARDADAGPFCIVVDAGYSFTHVVPLIDGRVFVPGVRRIDVGGKLLTNYLRELVSYGQVNLQDETLIVDRMKREMCFVSTDIDADLADLATLERQPSLPVRERIPLADRRALDARFTRRYVLPDFQTIMEGYPLPANTEPDEVHHLSDQMVTLRGECFIVPELIFSPSNLGLQQAGLAQVVDDVVNLCPREIRTALRENVLLAGGSTLFPNFAARLARDLGPAFKVRHVADPIRGACMGARHFVP